MNFLYILIKNYELFVKNKFGQMVLYIYICIKYKYMKESKFQQYVGTKFGKLEIISISPIKNNKKTWFVAKCECGTEVLANASKVIRGVRQGCQNCKNKGINNPKWTGYNEISGTYLKNLKKCAESRVGEKAVYTISNEYLWELFLSQERKCALSGLHIAFSKDSYNRGTASLDRINSDIGYIEGNVQWVHKDINKMKTDFDQEYFIDLCKLITMNKKKLVKTKKNNTVNVIYPYRSKEGIWAFDDEDINIFGEVFVGDINTMIDMFSEGKEKLTIFISSSPIPNFTLSLSRIKDSDVEGMYLLDGTDIEGWLCPCLLNYFPDYVDKIYAKIN